jgi:hypothetical protein
MAHTQTETTREGEEIGEEDPAFGNTPSLFSPVVSRNRPHPRTHLLHSLAVLFGPDTPIPT